LALFGVGVVESSYLDPTPVVNSHSWTALHAEIDAATEGNHTFFLGPTFTSDYDSPISISGKTVTVLGHGAVLDTGGKGRFFHVGASSSVHLANMTMQNGISSDSYGGALVVNPGGCCAISRCTLASNHAPGRGGGAIYLNGGSLHIDTSMLTLNTATFGGALYVGMGNLSVVGSRFLNNSNDQAVGKGGAVWTDPCTPAARFERSTFECNRAGAQGGGGAVYTSGPGFFKNCTFSDPTAGNDEVYLVAGGPCRPGLPNISVVTFECPDGTIGAPVDVTTSTHIDVTQLPPSALLCRPARRQ
jgi:hypothetical protein